MDDSRKPPSGPSAQMSPKDRESADSEASAIAALAKAWPRILVAAGMGEALAVWWCRARSDAQAKGRPPFPHVPADSDRLALLFEIRRSRRLVRGFEAIEEALAGQQAGLRRAPATEVQGERRISRMLVLSSDAAPRLYRNAQNLLRKYPDRLEALVLECDEKTLGESLFGSGSHVRALLLDHKDAVVDFLAGLLPEPEDAGESRSPACDKASRDLGENP